MPQFKHVWFDLDGTLKRYTKKYREDHDELLYKTYANATKRPVSRRLISEFNELYKREGGITNVFKCLGFSSDYWQKQYDTLDPQKYFKPDPEIIDTLKKLNKILPISLFTNSSRTNAKRTLKALGIKPAIFTHVVTIHDIEERKPHLSGFETIIKMSKIQPSQILYVGDRVLADILPAKETGLKTCLLWSNSNEADYSTKNFKELLNIVTNSK